MENLEDQFVKLNIEDLLGCIHGKDSDGKDLVVNEFIYNSFLVLVLGAFSISGIEKIFKKSETKDVDGNGI